MPNEFDSPTETGASTHLENLKRAKSSIKKGKDEANCAGYNRVADAIGDVVDAESFNMIHTIAMRRDLHDTKSDLASFRESADANFDAMHKALATLPEDVLFKTNGQVTASFMGFKLSGTAVNLARFLGLLLLVLIAAGMVAQFAEKIGLVDLGTKDVILAAVRQEINNGGGDE